MQSDIDHERRGLMKLMLRMPALRGKLQLTSVTNPDMLSLCGAFEDASTMLERLRKERSPNNTSAITEYEILCEELEQEIIEMCIR